MQKLRDICLLDLKAAFSLLSIACIGLITIASKNAINGDGSRDNFSERIIDSCKKYIQRNIVHVVLVASTILSLNMISKKYVLAKAKEMLQLIQILSINNEIDEFTSQKKIFPPFEED